MPADEKHPSRAPQDVVFRRINKKNTPANPSRTQPLGFHLGRRRMILHAKAPLSASSLPYLLSLLSPLSPFSFHLPRPCFPRPSHGVGGGHNNDHLEAGARGPWRSGHARARGRILAADDAAPRRLGTLTAADDPPSPVTGAKRRRSCPPMARARPEAPLPFPRASPAPLTARVWPRSAPARSTSDEVSPCTASPSSSHVLPRVQPSSSSARGAIRLPTRA